MAQLMDFSGQRTISKSSGTTVTTAGLAGNNARSPRTRSIVSYVVSV